MSQHRVEIPVTTATWYKITCDFIGDKIIGTLVLLWFLAYIHIQRTC